MSAGLLADVRILAVTQYGAGPYATQHLVDLGAEVIKVEAPGSGDYARGLPPYANADGSDSLFFQSLNHGTRSLTLDLKTTDGQQIFQDLAATSDAVFSNLRADVSTRLGLDYESLRRVNPQLVCCWLSGYGREEPAMAAPGFDYMVQAESGIMSLAGDPDQSPTKAGVSIIDFATGIAAAFAMVSGILGARTSGRGGDIDVTLRDTAASLLNYVATWHLSAGFEPERLADSAHPSLVPSQLFRTQDDPLIVMVNKERFWPLLTTVLGRPEWASAPDRNTFKARLEHRTEVVADLQQIFSTRTRAHWLQRLQEAGVPCGAVRTVPEAFEDPDYQRRTLSFTHPDFGEVRSPGPLVDNRSRTQATRAPALGEDTDAILAEILRLDPDRIADLHRLRVV